MSKRKYLVTFPIVGEVTLEVEASNVDDAKSKFLEKSSEIKLKGDVLEESESNHSWDFLEKVNTGNVFHGIIQEVIVELSESKCPECLEKTDQQELDMFGGLCESCCEDHD